MIFEYDIPNKCFYFKGYQEPISVFFEIYLEKCETPNLTNDFLVLKIAEKKDGESLMSRDQVVGSVLKNGVILKDTKYEIVGCSNSQVQKKSFVFGKTSLGYGRLVEETYIPNIKEVERKKGVAKRVKYAGLLFTGCRYMLNLPDDFQVRLNLCQLNLQSYVQGPKDSIKFSEREKALLNLKYNIDSRTFSQLYKFVNGEIIQIASNPYTPIPRGQGFKKKCTEF